MFEKNYIKKTFLQVGYPKIISFILGFVSFPLMIQSVGLADYGVYIYIGSLVGLVEVFMDFGITSAWGKHCSSLRTAKLTIENHYLIWLLCQMVFAVTFLLVCLFIRDNVNMDNKLIFIHVLLTLFFGVFHNFQKSTLNSLLYFKLVARLDLIESIFRTLIYVSIAFIYKSVESMALLFLISSIVLLLISSFWILIKVINKDLISSEFNGIDQIRVVFSQSVMFLWLRLSTRLFHEIPVIILKGYTNDYLVGLLGSLRKLIEYLIIPYSIIGNILMFRAKELVMERKNSILLENLNMIVFFTICLTPLILCFEHIIIKSFFDSYNLDMPLMPLLMVYLISHVMFALYAPVSDYLGALKERNYFLTMMVVVTTVILLAIALVNRNHLLLIPLIVLLNFILALGYCLISRKVILENSKMDKRSTSETLLINQFAITICFFMVKFLFADLINVQYMYVIFFLLFLLNFKLHNAFVLNYLKGLKEI